MAIQDDKQAFAARLNEALKRSPKRIETPTQLALNFNLLHPAEPITPQAAQKWLGGHNKPTPDKVETLATLLNVSAQWLMYGVAEEKPPPTLRSNASRTAQTSAAPSSDEMALLEKFRTLPEYQQHLVSEMIGQFALQQEMWQSNG